MLFIQVIYKIWMDETTTRDKGTMGALKVQLKCKQITKNIKSCYNAAANFVDKLGEALITTLAPKNKADGKLCASFCQMKEAITRSNAC